MFNRSPKVRAELAIHLGPGLIRRRAVAEVPLASYGALGFRRREPARRRSNRRRVVPVLACEAKLGATGLGGRRFEERFLAACGTSHGGARVRGSMPAILERKLPTVEPEGRLAARVGDDEHEVESRWALLVRRRAVEGWARRGRPALSSRCVVVAFDDLINVYGGCEPFNALVQEQGERFDGPPRAAH